VNTEDISDCYYILEELQKRAVRSKVTHDLDLTACGSETEWREHTRLLQNMTSFRPQQNTLMRVC